MADLQHGHKEVERKTFHIQKPQLSNIWCTSRCLSHEAERSLNSQEPIRAAALRNREPPEEPGAELQEPAHRAGALLSPALVQKVARSPLRWIKRSLDLFFVQTTLVYLSVQTGVRRASFCFALCGV